MSTERTQRIFNKYKTIIAQEVNVEEIYILPNMIQSQKVYVPLGKAIAEPFWKDTGRIITAAKAGAVEQLGDGHIRVMGDWMSWDLGPTMYEIRHEGLDTKTQAAWEWVLVQMDFTLTPQLIAKGRIRDISRMINQMRKDAQASIDARLCCFYNDQDGELWTIIETHKEFLMQEALLHTMQSIDIDAKPKQEAILMQHTYLQDNKTPVIFYLLA
jgi:hypothetical protein